MSNNKNIKLPQHLQLDSVSPATRLLEKRRLMYEVQKAFDDQKLEFAAKDKKFKLQETELREKDILIQDNLIKFSTFLQQQETKKFKDTEAATQEQARIEKLDMDISEQKIKLQIAKEKARQIENRVEQMKRYEQFLEKVKEANSEEFEDLIAILSKYKTQQSRNEDLKLQQKAMIEQFDQITVDVQDLELNLQSKKMEMSNLQAKRQEDQQRIDKEKSSLKQQQEEIRQTNSNQTTQTGQMLMTIKNLYEKCEHMKVIFPSLAGFNMEKYDNVNNFNSTGKSGEKALVQLQVIYKCLKNFIDLKREYQQSRKELNAGGDPSQRDRKYFNKI